MSDPLPAAIPAATVILIRDGETGGIETLMMHRTSRVAFGGMWVFPGGRVDEADRHSGVTDFEAARRAAVREAAEESGLLLDEDDLVVWAHWEPPPVIPKRFATWFFLAPAPLAAEVVVDGVEIHDHAWLAPEEVIARRDRGEVELAPPTWVTLHDLAGIEDVGAAVTRARSRQPIPRYVTHWREVPGGAVALWEGDAGYVTSDPGPEGPRHRLWMLESGWRLERD
jgi:8-oxo-dGTP pyrophosphatase MutT (NUDIX family)